ncbi:MAG: hypothetical protein PVF28_08055 [Thioalkalispiraceae bacterium]|jgi:hypothetical protein
MLMKRPNNGTKHSTQVAQVKFDERRSGEERRQRADRRSEARFGGEPDRRQGEERRKYPLLQRLFH